MDVERFRNSPLIGVGVSNSRIALYPKKRVNAHNGLLAIALASGAIPLAFFVAYWGRAARGVLRACYERLPEAPFLAPLFICAFVQMMVSAYAFMSPWHVVIIAVATSECAPRQMHRIIVRRTASVR